MNHFIILFPADMVHQVRNFGETLYYEFCEDRKANIALSDVDRATNILIVEVFHSKRNLRRVSKKIEELLKQELLFERAAVEFVNTEDA